MVKNPFGSRAQHTPGKDAHERVRREAVEAALREGQQRILGFLRKRLGNIEDADEVMQDFAMRAILRSDDLREVASVRGWLGRLLATAITDHHRRNNRYRKQALAFGAAVSSPDDVTLLDEETDAAVCACLHDLMGLLHPRTAELLRRIDLLGHSRDDVARALNISEGTLAVRLHRARRKMRDLLIQMCLTCPEHGFLDCACDRARARQRSAHGPHSAEVL